MMFTVLVYNGSVGGSSSAPVPSLVARMRRSSSAYMSNRGTTTIAGSNGLGTPRVLAPASVRSGSLTFVSRPRRMSSGSVGAPFASEPVATSRLGGSAVYPAALPAQPSGLGGPTVTSSPRIYQVAPAKASPSSVILEPVATGATLEPVVAPVTPIAASVVPSYAPAPTQGICQPVAVGGCTPVGSFSPAPVTPTVLGPAPVAVLTPAQIPVEVPPEQPQSLTAGFPDPVAIERQKAAYARGLNEQLQHGTDVLA